MQESGGRPGGKEEANCEEDTVVDEDADGGPGLGRGGPGEQQGQQQQQPAQPYRQYCTGQCSCPKQRKIATSQCNSNVSKLDHVVAIILLKI